MPSSKKAKEAIISLVPQDAKNIYELGSGWGHLIFPLAKQNPKSTIFAYEGSPIPYYFSKLIQKVLSSSNLELKRKDFFTISLRQADVVICYLYPGAMSRLEKKFIEELKPGTLVISNTFALRGLKATKTLILDDLLKTRVYLYVI